MLPSILSFTGSNYDSKLIMISFMNKMNKVQKVYYKMQQLSKLHTKILNMCQTLRTKKELGVIIKKTLGFVLKSKINQNFPKGFFYVKANRKAKHFYLHYHTGLCSHAAFYDALFLCVFRTQHACPTDF